MSMKMFYVYRTIRLNNENHPEYQMIAEIYADNIDIALARASFIKSFKSWDDQPGIVCDSDEGQPECTYAENLETITATSYGNECLTRQHHIIQSERERAAKIQSTLQEEFNSMLTTM